MVFGGCPVLADLAGPGTDSIGIVFGEDCFDTIVQDMTIKLRSGLEGTPTLFGWVLHRGSGSIPFTGVVARAHVHAFRASVDEQLQNFWTVHHFGVAHEKVWNATLSWK